MVARSINIGIFLLGGFLDLSEIMLRIGNRKMYYFLPVPNGHALAAMLSLFIIIFYMLALCKNRNGFDKIIYALTIVVHLCHMVLFTQTMLHA